jgi:hypothetical protein
MVPRTDFATELKQCLFERLDLVFLLRQNFLRFL